MERVAVLGAGNGGTAMVAVMGLQGATVSLFDKYEEALEGFKESKTIKLSGLAGCGEVVIDKVTTDIAEAIRDAQLILVVVPAFAHEEIAQEVAPFLKNNQVIVLNPGRTGGALSFKNTLRKYNCSANVVVAEAETLLYACRRFGQNESKIFGVKNEVGVAAHPSNGTKIVVEMLNQYFPQFIERKNVLATSFANIGAIFHPGPTVLNAGRIENTDGNFDYYHDGITESVGKVLEKIDEERLAIADAYGQPVPSVREWLDTVYGAKGESLSKAINNNHVYSGIKAPQKVNVRYITEDVPMSLVPLQAFGKLANVKTPTIDSIIYMASLMIGVDFEKDGRDLEAMGLEGLSLQGIKDFIDNH